MCTTHEGGPIYVLEEVLAEVSTGREAGESMGHEQPTSLTVDITLVEPGLRTELCKYLISQRVLGNTLLHNIVSYCLLPPAGHVGIIHEPQDLFSEGLSFHNSERYGVAQAECIY